MAEKCERCNEFSYSPNYSTRQIGFGIMILIPLIAGGTSVYAGISDEMIAWITLGSFSLGLLIVIYSFIFRQKTIEWSCSKCGFRQTHNY